MRKRPHFTSRSPSPPPSRTTSRRLPPPPPPRKQPYVTPSDVIHNRYTHSHPHSHTHAHNDDDYRDRDKSDRFYGNVSKLNPRDSASIRYDWPNLLDHKQVVEQVPRHHSRYLDEPPYRMLPTRHGDRAMFSDSTVVTPKFGLNYDSTRLRDSTLHTRGGMDRIDDHAVHDGHSRTRADLYETEGYYPRVFRDKYDFDMFETESGHPEMCKVHDECDGKGLLERNPLFRSRPDIHGPHCNCENCLSIEKNHDPRYVRQLRTYENIEQLQSSEGPRYETPSDWRKSKVFDEDEMVNPVQVSRKSAKERLQPARRSVKQRLGPVIGDVKERLGPTVSLNPLTENLYYKINDIAGFDSSKVKVKQSEMKPHKQLSESSKGKTPKTEPPEASKNFEHIVHMNFLKFVKALNEDAGLRKRYSGQGGVGDILKCSVCGRKSKDFADTLSLAHHAFLSTMVGFRGEHLGFHKALCALMGWNSKATPNGSWTWQELADCDARALKEDLIIWPPVVFIHNSSITSCNPAERLIVSTEKLNDILRGMGFGEGLAKVCNGRPANQSIMVVIFQSTLSGLKEAERLHSFYAKNNLGRADFESGDRKTQSTADIEVEKILYGYMGIADDLAKLDFETKKHCIVKSKKEVAAIALLC